MEYLKDQIKKEIKKVLSCELQDIQNVKDWGLSSKREGHLCIFGYVIPCGFLEKKKITIGIEFPVKDYPRLPPHFIHLKREEFSDREIGKIGKIHEEYEHSGERWIALSRPPQDIWDELDSSKKNLYTFFESHLRRLWESL